MQSDFEKFLADFPVINYEAGEYFIEQAAAPENVFYIQEGNCVGSIFTPSGNEYFFDPIPAGQGIRSVAGLGTSFLKEFTFNSSVVALSDVVCRKIPCTAMHEYLLAHPQDLMEFTSKLITLYFGLCQRISSRGNAHTIEQYCRYILQNSRLENGERIFERSQTIAEISRQIGVHPVTLSRMTTALIDNHCLEKTAKYYKIIDPALLTNVAYGYETITYRQDKQKTKKRG